MTPEELEALADALQSRPNLGGLRQTTLAELAVYDAERWSAAAALRACAERLRAEEWQPIETAPRDGTRVLAWWPDAYDNGSAVQVETWWGPFHGSALCGWQSAFEEAAAPPHGPTHWRPRPAPPAEEE